MALVVKDRIKETTTTTGTGTLTLAGAVTKFQSFSVVGDGNTTYYAIESGNGTDWEIGVGTYTASGTTLSRDTILESSNAGSAINLSGTSTVFCTYPAERSVNTADIGSTVQAYDADTAKYDDTTANFTGTLQNGGSNVVVDSDIGSTVQGYDANTAKYDDTTANFTGTLQQGGSNVLTGNQTITLSGDVSGSGTTAITVTVADDSHNHVISNVDGLQTALDGKQPLDADLTAIGGLANTDGNFIVGNGTTWVAESGATARTSLGLGSLATLSSVNAATITDNSVGAAELNVSGNGTASQFLRSDGDGTFTWATPTPAALSTASGSAPSYSARAWASFNGGTSPAAGTIQGSGNVSSVTDNATGQATINFATAMPNANYAVVGMCTGYSNYNSTLMVMGSANGSGNQLPTTKTTSAIKVHFGHSNTVVNEHVGLLTIAVIG